MSLCRVLLGTLRPHSKTVIRFLSKEQTLIPFGRCLTGRSLDGGEVEKAPEPLACFRQLDTSLACEDTLPVKPFSRYESYLHSGQDAGKTIFSDPYGHGPEKLFSSKQRHRESRYRLVNQAAYDDDGSICTGCIVGSEKMICHGTSKAPLVVRGRSVRAFIEATMSTISTSEHSSLIFSPHADFGE